MAETIFYRAVFEKEYNDYLQHKLFRTAENTIEGKQFFKTKRAAAEFMRVAKIRNFQPDYVHILKVYADESCMGLLKYDELILDNNLAITLHQKDLAKFNECVKFVDTV